MIDQFHVHWAAFYSDIQTPVIGKGFERAIDGFKPKDSEKMLQGMK